MLSKRREAAQQVVNHLMATEAAIDLALVRAAELFGSLPTARLHANIAAEVGHGAIEQMTETVVALVRARGQIVATHRELAETRDQIGLRTVSFGGLAEKAAARPSHLELVERTAA
ncbi:hypothetical protein [Sphingomonas oleivorans]|nr:hypothetical protein [Sphingomonas oleivorans]